MRLLRLKSSPTVDLTSQFTVNWASPIHIKPGAKLALKNLALKGIDTQYVKLIQPLIFKVKILSSSDQDPLRTVSVPAGKYLKQDFLSALTTALNATMDSQIDDSSAYFGFEWRCSYTTTNKLNITFNKKDSNAGATFTATDNILKTNNRYKRNSGSGNDSYIISVLPVNRGCADNQFTIQDGTATSVFYVGKVSGTPNNNTLLVSDYIYGVGINPADNYYLYTIVNGKYGSKIGNGYNSTQFTGVNYYNSYGNIKVQVLNGINIIATQTIVNNANLYDNYFTGVTLNTSDISFGWSFYYDSPYPKLVNNQVIEVVEKEDNVIISNLDARQSSIVTLYLQQYLESAKTIGFLAQNYTSPNTADYTFSGSYALQFVSLEDVIVEILSMSFLESYDTEVGYKRPIIYTFDSLIADTYGNAFNNVDYPIYVSLKNDHEIALSSMTIRISSSDSTFETAGGISLLLLIDDGI